jgi:hypothetical protein
MQIATSRTGRQDAALDTVDLLDLPQHRKLLGSHTLMETFPIRLPDGREWVGSLWTTPSRRNGRRIQVRDEQGAGLFDTDDCYDQANATNALELWLQDQIVHEKSSIIAADSEERSVRETAVGAVNRVRSTTASRRHHRPAGYGR